jgi:diguanylate cyclase (GGDEF)-like protein/PAS domain S-box-containing protein
MKALLTRDRYPGGHPEGAHDAGGEAGFGFVIPPPAPAGQKGRRSDGLLTGDGRLPARTALLDADGVIVSTNAPWREFAAEGGLRDTNAGVGQNYLAVCDAACGGGEPAACEVAAGIRAVLAGTVREFCFEYRCDSPSEKRWFLLTVTPLDHDAQRGAVALHVDITARKQAEEDLNRFVAAMDTSPDAIFLVDRATLSTVHVNEAACRLHRMSREEVLALRPWDAYGAAREDIEAAYDALIAGGGSEAQEIQWIGRGAEPLWIEIRRHALSIGGRWTVVVLIRDVTARRESQRKIVYLNRVYALLSGINALIVRVRDRGELFREACRIAVEEGSLAMAWIGVLDARREHVLPMASAGIDEEFWGAITRRLAGNSLSAPGDSLPTQVASSKQAFVSNDTQTDPRNPLAELHVKCGIRSIAILPLLTDNEAVGVLTLYAREAGFFDEQQLQLLTELAANVAFALQHLEKQERLDYLAYYDDLTGLANRPLFLERVALYVGSAATAQHRLAVCCIDLERFKNINDSLGRAAGDELLRQVAQWLTEDAGDINILARIDADRFALVLPVLADEEEVARSLEKILKAFANHSFRLNEASYRIALKVGIAMYPDDGGDADTLFRHAEAALKKAKVGGDRYLFYAQKMTETVVGRLNLENRLRRALELNEFVLHYQPKLNVATGALVGAEALIRWNDPQTGLVPPARFIPILEETGLIHEVGRWALNQAMQDYLSWRNAGLAVVRIAVNLSPLQLRSRDFIAEIQALLSQDPNAAAGLELELTESLIMEDIKLSTTKLESLRAMGVRIAIDDFGTGFSSLSYLSTLPVDTVKIDRSFIVGMLNGPEGHTLVSIIINLAHALKLKVVAEGVETEQQRNALRALDCDEIQGFFISKPLPAALFMSRYLDPLVDVSAASDGGVGGHLLHTHVG